MLLVLLLQYTTAGLDVVTTGSTFCVFGNGGGLGIFDVFIIAGLDVVATGSTFFVGNGGGLGIFDVFIIAGLLHSVVFSGKDGTSGGVSVGLISRMSLLIFSIFCLVGILRLL